MSLEVLLGGFIWNIVRTFLTLLSLVVFSMERSTSWKVLALILDDFLKNIVENGLGIVGVADILADTKNVTALLDVVLKVFVVAFISELRHFNLFSSELFIEIVQVEAWWGQVFDTREKDRSLQLRHWGFKLGWNKLERFMLYSKLVKKFNWLGNEVSVKFIQVVYEESCKILWKIIRFLQTWAKTVSQSGDVGNMSVVLNLSFFFDGSCEISVVTVK